MSDEPSHIWSPEAEQTVLGALMEFPDAGAALAGECLAASDFYDDSHRLIWNAIQRGTEAAGFADIISTHEALKSDHADEYCGGIAYLNRLAQSVVSVRHAAALARIVKEKARRRRLAALGASVGLAALELQDPAELKRRISDLSDELLQQAEPAGATGRRLPFSPVPLDAMAGAVDSPVQWAWRDYMPAGEVTLLAAHGGTGKSTLALHLAFCVALGRPYLGQETAAGRVLFYSAEDPSGVVLRRLARISRAEGIDAADLGGRLLIVDATEGDPVLFGLRRVDGLAHGFPTSTHQALAEYMEEHDISLLIVDNASDVFDADEINRTHVRAFLRSLVGLVRARAGAVLLLAHVSKVTSRAGRGPSDGESYSGSTQWHNGVRSRLTLVKLEPGRLELRHEKSNHGREQEPLQLDWPEGGMPSVHTDGASSVIAERVRDAADLRALLICLHEFNGRGEWVSTSASSPRNAARLLAGEMSYPKHRAPGQVFGLLRGAEREGLIERMMLRGADRKGRECWRLAPKGQVFVGAATAATAETYEDCAVGKGRGNCGNPPPIGGGCRGVAAAQGAAL